MSTVERAVLGGTRFDPALLDLPGGPLPTTFEGVRVLRIDGPPDDSSGPPPADSWRLLLLDDAGATPVATFAAPAGNARWWVVHLVRETNGWRGVIHWPEPVLHVTTDGTSHLVMEWAVPAAAPSSPQALRRVGVRVRRRNGDPLDPHDLDGIRVIARLASSDSGVRLPSCAGHVFAGPTSTSPLPDGSVRREIGHWCPEPDELPPGSYQARAELVGQALTTPVLAIEIETRTG